MDNLMNGIPVYVALPGAAVLIALACFITVKAMREGREISFWPPRIGPRLSTPASETEKTVQGSSLSSESAPGLIKWERAENVFWIGHDLRELIDVLLDYEASKETILRCLNQVDSHARALGLDSVTEPQAMLLHVQNPEAATTLGVMETVVSRVSRLIIEVQASPQKSLITKRRKDWARQIREILDLMGRLARSRKVHN